MLPRFIEKQVLKCLKPQLVVGLFGARRTGKTILMEEIRKKISGKILFVDGYNLDTAEILSSQRLNILQKFVSGYDYLFVDEAQKIPNIGQNLKLLVDHVKNLSILVSGSSAFDLQNKIGEPLVGRSSFFNLYPFSQLELNEDFLQAKESLESKLIYGLYPQSHLAESNEEKRNLLLAVRDGYLLKDILSLDNLKNSQFIRNLLKLIAFQIGNDVSLNELANNLNVNRKTVARYLELLEKCFIIFSLHGFSRNLRKEYTKTPRYYFWDNGIRNAVISNFNSLNLRDDVGKLWENYCISERIKALHNKNIIAEHYFWRTYDQQEIDLIEERQGKLFAYEFKWRNNKAKNHHAYKTAYPQSKFTIINQENYLDFIV